LARNPRIVARRTVIRRLSLDGEVLDRLEELELVVPVRRPGKERAYRLDDIDRLRVYLLLTQELGVNPPGAEIILRLRGRLMDLQQILYRMLTGIRNQGLLDKVREVLSSLDQEPW